MAMSSTRRVMPTSPGDTELASGAIAFVKSDAKIFVFQFLVQRHVSKIYLARQFISFCPTNIHIKLVHTYPSATRQKDQPVRPSHTARGLHAPIGAKVRRIHGASFAGLPELFTRCFSLPKKNYKS
jgi:hypothetical protein